MKTAVRVLRGPWRGRRGFIAGDLQTQNPHATKAAVFSGGDIAAIKIASLERDRQLSLALDPSCLRVRTADAPPAAIDQIGSA